MSNESPPTTSPTEASCSPPSPSRDILEEVRSWLMLHSFSEKTWVQRAHDALVNLREEVRAGSLRLASVTELAVERGKDLADLREQLERESLHRAAAENELDRLRGLILEAASGEDTNLRIEAEKLLAERGGG